MARAGAGRDGAMKRLAVLSWAAKVVMKLAAGPGGHKKWHSLARLVETAQAGSY